jgi:hypothetical protein
MTTRPVIDLSTQISPAMNEQIWRMRGSLLCALLAGAFYALAIGCVFAAWDADNQVAPIAGVLFFVCVGIFKSIISIGLAAKVLNYAIDGDEIIANQRRGLDKLHNDNIGLLLRQSLQQGWEEGADSAILSASVIPMTKLH